MCFLLLKYAVQYPCEPMDTQLICLLFIFQLDADRDEEEVFCDISMTLDNKLFPSKKAEAGEKLNDSNNYWSYHMCTVFSQL